MIKAVFWIGLSMLNLILVAGCNDQDEDIVEDYTTPQFESYSQFRTHLSHVVGSSGVKNRRNKIVQLLSELQRREQLPFRMGDQVAFLYYSENARSIEWHGSFNKDGRKPEIPNKGKNMDGSGLWLLEKTFPVDARVRYFLEVDGKNLLDDRNPHQFHMVNQEEPGAYRPFSELRMPDYREPVELLDNTSINKGAVSDILQIESPTTGYQTNFLVYTPSGYDSLSDLPVLYVTDANRYADPLEGRLIVALDNLIASGEIPPIIAVLLDPREPINGENRRIAEYLDNYQDYGEFLTKELVPYIDSAYKTRAESTARIMMGASAGGFFSAYIGIAHSDVFANLIVNSPSFWWSHENYDSHIQSLYRDSDIVPIRFVMNVGTIWDGTITSTREMKEIMQSKGYEFKYKEVNDDHSWGNWRRLYKEELQYLLL